VLEWLRAHGKGHQTLINQVLRAWYDAQIGRAPRKGRRGPEGGGKERSEKNRCQVISEKGRSQARRASPMRLSTDAAFFEDREGSRWATVNLNAIRAAVQAKARKSGSARTGLGTSGISLEADEACNEPPVTPRRSSCSRSHLLGDPDRLDAQTAITHPLAMSVDL
jgi:hypothetical protein